MRKVYSRVEIRVGRLLVILPLPVDASTAPQEFQKVLPANVEQFLFFHSLPTTGTTGPRCKRRGDRSRWDGLFTSSESDVKRQLAQIYRSPSTYVVRLVKNDLLPMCRPCSSAYPLLRSPHRIVGAQIRTHRNTKRGTA
jgi:hypothetical protein